MTEAYPLVITFFHYETKKKIFFFYLINLNISDSKTNSRKCLLRSARVRECVLRQPEVDTGNKK